MKRLTWLCLFISLSLPAWAATPPPILFFTDIIDGPTSGNSDTTYSSTGGAYITLYGNFLDNYSSVQLNGNSCLTVVVGPQTWRWYERMVVKLGTSCTSGNFSITTPNGTWSGPTVETTEWGRAADFTVTSGVIRYVATNGSDTAAGSFSAPWAHPWYGVETLGALAGGGNVLYVKSGSGGTYSTDDGQGWGANITFRTDWSSKSGTATASNAIVGYPYANYPTTEAVIGCEGSGCPDFALRSTDTDAWTVANCGYWTFAELGLRSADNGGAVIGLAGGSPPGSLDARGWRLVGLDVTSPTGGNNTATPFQVQSASQGQILGNWEHDILLAATSRLDQAMYLSTDADYWEIGWNEIYNSGGRGGIQTHSSNLCWLSCGNSDRTGWILHDLAIHDNIIHHIAEEGILVDTADPGKPCTQSFPCGVKIYNNVIYDVGRDGSASDAGHMQLSGDFTNCPGGACDIGTSPPPEWWYNNTITCTTSGEEACWGSWFPDIHSGPGYPPTVTVRHANNIIYSQGSVPYLAPQTYLGSTCSSTDNSISCPAMSGSKNLLYGNGAATYTNLMTGTINLNPQFVNPGSFNFALQNGSPAIGAGLHTIQDATATKSIPAPTYDITGLVRPNPPSIGAYEYGSATVVAAAAPVFSPSAPYNGIAVSVTMTTSSGGAIICYRTDGVTPVIGGVATCPAGSLAYTAPILTSATTTYTAVAGGTGYTDSTVTSGTYTISRIAPSVVIFAELKSINHPTK